jgi:hypothetical protein
MHAPFINHRARLAEAIARDLLRPAHKPQTSPTCFTCGRSFIKGDGRFCHRCCRAAFDAGLPPFEPLDLDKSYSLPKGPTGFNINCKFCQTRFDSRGLRCCSTECERKFRQKQELDVELTDDPFRAVKRKCENCGGDIPNWRNGRRVSAATKFCSVRCQRKGPKNGGLASGSSTPVFDVQTAKKCPENGPLQMPPAATSVSDGGAS